MFRRLQAMIGSLLVLVMLVALIPASSVLAATSLTESQAITLLQAYALVRGDPSGSLLLDEQLTRAQAATLFIRSMGAEDAAKMLADTVPFTDARGHWGAGAIALAERMNLMKGDGNGTFRPNSSITYAEVLTVLLRMISQEPAGPWNAGAILQAAGQLGFAPSGVQGTEPAIRRKIFWSLATAISQVQTPNGQTVLQRYVDHNPPALTLDSASVNTAAATADITGSAGDATSVLVGGKPANLDRASGRFSYTASLNVGTATLTVEAFDLAGNRATATFTATRKPSVARIEIVGPTTLQVNSTNKLTVTAFDAQNRAVALDGLEADVTGDVAAFNVATTTLTTSSRTGNGTVTLRIGNVRQTFQFSVNGLSARAVQLRIASINGGRSPMVGKDATVTVQVLDANGTITNDDYGRPVTLTSSGLSGVVIVSRTVNTQAGAATFTIRGTAEGTATLTATADNLDNAVDQIQFLSATRVVLTATPASLKADGTSTASIRASLQDENGRGLTNNTNTDVVVTLTATGTDGQLTTSQVFIPRGASSSAWASDAVFRAGIRSGTATISGWIASDHRYSVQSLTLPVTDNLAGGRFQFTYPAGRVTPNGAATPITVRVVDAQNRLITTGSYAFQFAVATSNGETVKAGLPDGLDLTFANSSYRPVDDGRNSSDPLNDASSVVGRTYQGTATLYLKYNKSGVVTLTPRLLGPTDAAFNDVSGFGPAAASSGMTGVQPFQVTFAAAAARVSLTVDSTLGRDQPGGAVATASTMTIRARVVDAAGAAIPGYSDYVTLTRTANGTGVTNIVGSNRKITVNGVAEFTIQATGVPGFDTYRAAAGALSSSDVTVSMRTAQPDTPDIAAVRGYKEGNLSPMNGYVAPDDTYMDIQLQPQPSPQAGESHYWVTAKVFRKGEYSPFFTSGAIDLASDLAVIRIPKASLRTGRFTYQVTINNGVRESGRSTESYLSEAVNVDYNSRFILNSALFDAATGRLTLNTSNLTTGGTIAKEHLRIVKGNQAISLSDASVNVVSVTSTAVVLDLGNLAAQLDPELYNGTVTLQAEDGWFATADGSQIAPATSSSLLKPLALITHATIDVANQRLYLYGAGFQQGTLLLDRIKIQAGSDVVTLHQGTTTTTDRLSSITDTQLVVALSQTSLDAIKNLAGAQAYVTADIGWLKITVGSTAYNAPPVSGTNHPLLVQAFVRSAEYNPQTNTFTIVGGGFTGGTLNPGKLLFRASGTTTDWRPGTAAVAAVANDNTITVQLSDADARTFETSFGGKSLFMNTQAGWLIDNQGRSAAPLPTNSILFGVPR